MPRERDPLTRAQKDRKWRDDPHWQLVHLDTDAYPNGGPTKPSAEAELCDNGGWASVFRQNRAVATWVRPWS